MARVLAIWVVLWLDSGMDFVSVDCVRCDLGDRNIPGRFRTGNPPLMEIVLTIGKSMII